MNLLVALVVIAVAAATFVFSYDGVHAIALLGGMSAQLARYYPGLFDAVLVIACVAAVVLRDARWWARLWAWVVLVVVLAAIGATDVLHAMNYTLRQRPTEGIVAAAPVVAVLLAFSLLLTMLRQSRIRGDAPPAQTRGRRRPRGRPPHWPPMRLRRRIVPAAGGRFGDRGRPRRPSRLPAAARGAEAVGQPAAAPDPAADAPAAVTPTAETAPTRSCRARR